AHEYAIRDPAGGGSDGCHPRRQRWLTPARARVGADGPPFFVSTSPGPHSVDLRPVYPGEPGASGASVRARFGHTRPDALVVSGIGPFHPATCCLRCGKCRTTHV